MNRVQMLWSAGGCNMGCICCNASGKHYIWINFFFLQFTNIRNLSNIFIPSTNEGVIVTISAIEEGLSAAASKEEITTLPPRRRFMTMPPRWKSMIPPLPARRISAKNLREGSVRQVFGVLASMQCCFHVRGHSWSVSMSQTRYPSVDWLVSGEC